MSVEGGRVSPVTILCVRACFRARARVKHLLLCVGMGAADGVVVGTGLTFPKRRSVRDSPPAMSGHFSVSG